MTDKAPPHNEAGPNDRGSWREQLERALGRTTGTSGTPDACFITVKRKRNIYLFIYLFHVFLSQHLVQETQKKNEKGADVTSEETEEWRETQEVEGRKGGKSTNFSTSSYSKLHPFFFPLLLKKPEVNAHFILPLVTHSASHQTALPAHAHHPFFFSSASLRHVISSAHYAIFFGFKYISYTADLWLPGSKIQLARNELFISFFVVVVVARVIKTPLDGVPWLLICYLPRLTFISRLLLK